MLEDPDVFADVDAAVLPEFAAAPDVPDLLDASPLVGWYVCADAELMDGTDMRSSD
jgi:hypothetical protein